MKAGRAENKVKTLQMSKCVSTIITLRAACNEWQMAKADYKQIDDEIWSIDEKEKTKFIKDPIYAIC